MGLGFRQDKEVELGWLVVVVVVGLPHSARLDRHAVQLFLEQYRVRISLQLQPVEVMVPAVHCGVTLYRTFSVTYRKGGGGGSPCLDATAIGHSRSAPSEISSARPSFRQPYSPQARKAALSTCCEPR